MTGQNLPGASSSLRGRAASRRLLDAATALFAARGFASVSMREVSMAAGNGNNSAVSYYFAGKQGLIDALAADIGGFLLPRFDRLLNRLEAIPPADLTAYEIGLSINAPFFALYGRKPNGKEDTGVLSRFVHEPVADLDPRHFSAVHAIYVRFAKLTQGLVPDKAEDQVWFHLSHAVLAIIDGLTAIPVFSTVDVARDADERFSLLLHHNDYVTGGLLALETLRPPIDHAFWRNEIEN